jgi:uncharacterized protein (TIGR02594 family)
MSHDGTVPAAFGWAWEAWQSGDYVEDGRRGSSNSQVDGLFDAVGHRNLNDDTPWCGAFMGSALQQGGSTNGATNPLWARDYLKTGAPVDLSQAQVGDIVVFKRGSGGHVGFYMGQEGDKIKVLGGNQSNQVSVQSYKKSDLLGVRRIEDGQRMPDPSGGGTAAKTKSEPAKPSNGETEKPEGQPAAGGSAAKKKRFLHVMSVVQCRDCPGRLVFAAGMPIARQRGRGFLLEPQVKSATILGCTQYGGGRKPCTGVASIVRGPCTTIRVGRQKTVLDDLEVITNGSPPHRARVVSHAGAVVAETKGQGWVDLTVRDIAGQPLANERYDLTLPDGSRRQGRLDDQGRLRIDGLPAGALGKIRFPDLEGDDPEDPEGAPPEPEAPGGATDAPAPPPASFPSPPGDLMARRTAPVPRSDAPVKALEKHGKYYRVNPEVTMNDSLHAWIDRVSRRYHEETGQTLVVTSGVRTPGSQARLMFDRIRRGDDLYAIYEDKAATREILDTYDRCRRTRKGESATCAALETVIADQLDRGHHRGGHLGGKALDIRIHDMGPRERAVFKRIAGGEARDVLDEGDHWHVEV